MKQNNQSVIYCPFCVDYFEDIIDHYYENHERECVGYDTERKLLKYTFPAMGMWFVTERRASS